MNIEKQSDYPQESARLADALRRQFEQPEFLTGSDFSHIEIDSRKYIIPSYGTKGPDLPFEPSSAVALSYAEAMIQGILYNEPVVFYMEGGRQADNHMLEARFILYRLTGISSTDNVIIDGDEIKELNEFISEYGYLFTDLQSNAKKRLSVKPTLQIRHAELLPKEVRDWILVQLEGNRVGNRHLRPDGKSPLTLFLVDIEEKQSFFLRGVPKHRDGRHLFAYAHERAMITPDLSYETMPKNLTIVSKKAETTVPMQGAEKEPYMHPVFDIANAVKSFIEETKGSVLKKIGQLLKFSSATEELSSKSLLDLLEDTVYRASMRLNQAVIDAVSEKAPEELDEVAKKKWAVHHIMMEIVDGLTQHPVKQLDKSYKKTAKSMSGLLDNIEQFSLDQDEQFSFMIHELHGALLLYNDERIGTELRSKLDDPRALEALRYLIHRGQYQQVTDAIRGKNSPEIQSIRYLLAKADPELFYESLVGVEDASVRIEAAGTAIKTAFDLYQNNNNLSASAIKQQHPTKRSLENAIVEELSENPKFIALIARGLQLLQHFPGGEENMDTLTIRNKAFEFFAKLKVDDVSVLDIEGIPEEEGESITDGFRQSFLLRMTPVLSQYIDTMLSDAEKKHWLSWEPFFEQEFTKFREENFRKPNRIHTDEDVATLKNVYKSQFLLMTLLCYSMVGDSSRQLEFFKQSILLPSVENVLDQTNPVPQMISREGVHKVIQIYTPGVLNANIYGSFRQSLDILFMLSDTYLASAEAKERRERFLQTYSRSEIMLESLLYSTKETELYLRHKDFEQSVDVFKLFRKIKSQLGKNA